MVQVNHVHTNFSDGVTSCAKQASTRANNIRKTKMHMSDVVHIESSGLIYSRDGEGLHPW